MSPPDPLLIVCPDCGAANRDGETVCFLCGQRLGAADAKQVIGHAVPQILSTSRPTFHISSFLLLIALIAICLGVGHEQPFLGIALAVVVLPAAVYTTIIAFRSAAAGRPMSVFAKVLSFSVAITGVMAIEFAALVAFCMTCIPARFVAAGTGGNGEVGLYVAVGVGGIAAIAVAVYMTYYLLTRRFRLARKAGKR